MKKETRDVWVADDGTEFSTALECQIHEALLVEQELVDEFLKTQRWDEKKHTGYADRTLTTMRRVMIAFVKYKVQHNASTPVAQASSTQPRPTIQD